MTTSMTSPSTPSVLIFMTGHNCQSYVERAIQSVASQSHSRVSVLFVDDCSTDATPSIATRVLQQALPGRHSYVRNEQRKGKAFSASRHLRQHAPQHDIVAVIDADDQLIDASALAQIAKRYTEGHDVVWSNYVTDTGRPGHNAPLRTDISPRAQKWLTSHLFTFRGSLFAQIPEHYFQHLNGQWLEAACDAAIAYPVLDQTRRYCHLPAVLYQYTESNPSSHHNQNGNAAMLTSPRQHQCLDAVLKKAPLPRLDISPRQPAVAASVTTSPTPEAKPMIAHPSRPWEQALASHLLQSLPNLLSHVPVEQLMAVPVLPAADMFQRASGSDSKAWLAVGQSPITAFARGLAGCMEGAFLQIQAAHDHADPATDAVVTPWAEYVIGDTACYMPEFNQLPEHEAFEHVVIARNAWGAQPHVVNAVAALAPHLSMQRFSIWCVELTEQEAADAEMQLRAEMPEFHVKVISGDTHSVVVHT